METNLPRQARTGGTPLLLLGTVLSGAAMAVVPFALLVVPALFAYAMCRTKPGFLALFGAAYAIPAFLLTPPLTALCLSLLCIGAAFALYVMQTHRMSNAYTALALFGVALVALYAAVCLPGILSGEGAFAPVQAAVDAMVEMMTDVVRQTVASLPELGASASVGVESYLALLEAFRETASMLVVPVLCVIAGLLGLSNLLFFRLFARARVQNLSPMRPFRLWAIPSSVSYGLLLLLCASLVLLWAGWDYAESFSSTVNVLVGMPFLLQGLCVTDFLIVRKGKNVAAKRALIYIGAALLFQISQSLMMLLGCFEQVFHLRARLQALPPAMPRDGF